MGYSLYVFEGVDGTGKTTLCTNISKELGIIYYRATPPFHSILRPLVNEKCPPLIRFWYYQFGNWYTYFKLKKQLRRTDVIIDQYVYGTTAFHSVSLNKKLQLPRLFIQPKKVIYLYASWVEIDHRFTQRGKRSKLEKIEYLQKVDKVYRQLLSHNTSVIYFDTTQGNPLENTQILVETYFKGE